MTSNRQGKKSGVSIHESLRDQTTLKLNSRQIDIGIRSTKRAFMRVLGLLQSGLCTANLAETLPRLEYNDQVINDEIVDVTAVSYLSGSNPKHIILLQDPRLYEHHVPAPLSNENTQHGVLGPGKRCYFDRGRDAAEDLLTVNLQTLLDVGTLTLKKENCLLTAIHALAAKCIILLCANKGRFGF
jgi:hypothetical protein